MEEMKANKTFQLNIAKKRNISATDELPAIAIKEKISQIVNKARDISNNKVAGSPSPLREG